MLLQKFPKTVSYTVIMAVIPKINENSASGGGGMRSVRYPMKNRKYRAVFILMMGIKAASCFHIE